MIQNSLARAAGGSVFFNLSMLHAIAAGLYLEFLKFEFMLAIEKSIVTGSMSQS